MSELNAEDISILISVLETDLEEHRHSMSDYDYELRERLIEKLKHFGEVINYLSRPL